MAVSHLDATLLSRRIEHHVRGRNFSDIRSQPGDPVAFAVEVAIDRSHASIAVAGSRPDGRRHVELVERAAGTAWVAQRLAELKDRWNPKAVAIDPGGPAGSLIAAIEKEGVELLKVTVREVAQASGAFYDAVLEGSIRHRGQLELTAAMKAATKRPLGAAFAWTRIDTTTDISPLVASTLALFAHEAEIDEPAGQVWFMN